MVLMRKDVMVVRVKDGVLWLSSPSWRCPTLASAYLPRRGQQVSLPFCFLPAYMWGRNPGLIVCGPGPLRGWGRRNVQWGRLPPKSRRRRIFCTILYPLAPVPACAASPKAPRAEGAGCGE